MYKVKYRLVPDFICDIFSTKSCKYNSRNQNFDIPRFNSVLFGKHSLRYQENRNGFAVERLWFLGHRVEGTLFR